MITKSELQRRQQEAHRLFQKAQLVITPAEQAQIEIADFGLSAFEQTGLGVLVYVNTQRCCAKELAMWPRQTCPEHRHPNVGGQPGKEETFRCRWGKVFLYVSGAKAASPKCRPPAG
ncbi:MAG: D-lyxose/D-mannose family sugar isomerase, partial [Opitutaceae bacterium]